MGFNELIVRDVMHPKVQLIKEGVTIQGAIQLMTKLNISSLIVEPEHSADAYGIITRKDIVIEASENMEGFRTLQVRDLATKPVVTIQADIGVKHAIRLMRLIGVRRLVVLDGKELAGVISNGDIYRRLIKEL